MAVAYYSVPIGIGVARKGHVESLLEADHTCHRIDRRRVRPDLAVPIDCHEAERRIDDVVHNLQIESVTVANGIPVSHARTAQRIHTDANFTLADYLKIDHRGKIIHIGIEVLIRTYRRSASSTFKWYSRHPAQAGCDKGVRLLLYPFGDLSVCWSTVRRIVFEASESRRVFWPCDDDTVPESTLPTAIVVNNPASDYTSSTLALFCFVQ